MSLKKQLTFRYAIALISIACVLFVSYGMIFKQVKLNEKDAYLINISGMQRMLSQRTALMALQVSNAQDDNESDMYAAKMKVATDRMRRNHEELVSGDLREHGSYILIPALQQKYFGEDALAQDIDSYLAMLDSFLNLYNGRGLAGVQSVDFAEEIVDEASNGLLSRLNDVVSVYEKAAEQKVARFRQIETIVLIVGLSVLVFEVLFIFRPMVSSVTRSIEALEIANAELTEFSYRISHDLKAPIVSSRGLADAGANAIEKGDYTIAAHAMEHIKKSMLKLEALVGDVLNLTERKLTDAPTEDVDVSEMLDEIMSKISNLPTAKGIDFQIDLDFSQTLNVKRVYLQQTMENFISNAIKYSDPDKDNSFIKITGHLKRGICTLRVTDNGIGIPEMYREQLFGMFKRFHPKHSFGSGLGLYLVKQNALALGGNVNYEPTDDGSCFSVSFPYN